MASETVAIPSHHYSLIDTSRGDLPHGSTNVLFLARVTCDSRRELTYRVHDPEPVNGALGQAVTEHQTREWSLFHDESWDAAQIFHELYEFAE